MCYNVIIVSKTQRLTKYIIKLEERNCIPRFREQHSGNKAYCKNVAQGAHADLNQEALVKGGKYNESRNEKN